MLLAEMDAFIQAVEDARRALIRNEGQDVSKREVIRRAGYSDDQRAGVMYHLNPRRSWPRGHRVPPEMVERLARALKVPHEDLARAAQVAAGFNVALSEVDEVPYVLARFFEDAEVTREDKQRMLARLSQIVSEAMGRQLSGNGGS